MIGVTSVNNLLLKYYNILILLSLQIPESNGLVFPYALGYFFFHPLPNALVSYNMSIINICNLAFS